LTGIHAELVQSYLSAKGNSRSRESDGTEDYIDYAVSSYDREFLLSLTELEQQRLKLVDEALRRLDRGEYGLCVQCERPIRPKRLEVQPWARYCVRCQELADRGGIGDSGDLPEEDEEDLDDGEFEDEEFEEAEEDEVDSDEEELIES
jgi:DnaK suppressor protein